MGSLHRRLLSLAVAGAFAACTTSAPQHPSTKAVPKAESPSATPPAAPVAEVPAPAATSPSAEVVVASTTQPVEPEPAPVQFTGTSAETWKPVFTPEPKVADRSTFTHMAVVTALSVPLYSKAEAKTVVGYTGIGSRVPAIPSGKACPGGEWVAVTGEAHLCTGDGATLKARPVKGEVLDAWGARRVPKIDRPSPYLSAALRNGAPIFRRLPTAKELAQVDAGKKPKVIKRVLDGTLLFAYLRTVRSGEESLLELLSGEYIREKDVAELFPEPPIRGELLGKDAKLPLAFTFQEAPVYCLDGESPEPCGTAAKHARFFNTAVLDVHDQQLLAVGDGLAIPRNSVRIAEKIARPKGIGRKEQWIHIDLTEQTLVAYQGSTPLRATLISTGKQGHATPRGLYQVNRVYQTKPMNGVDELGPYQVQEVPWTLFFRGNYAMHGAYWHNSFGGPRSHGCVNIPPADARWLYYWSKPQLPTGWTASVRITGPRVYITGETPAEQPVQPQVASKSPADKKGSNARSLD